MYDTCIRHSLFMNNKAKKEIIKKTSLTSLIAAVLNVIVAPISFLLAISYIWEESAQIIVLFKILTIPISICSIVAIISGIISLFLIKKSISSKKGELIRYRKMSIVGITAGVITPGITICFGIFAFIFY